MPCFTAAADGERELLAADPRYLPACRQHEAYGLRFRQNDQSMRAFSASRRPERAGAQEVAPSR
jgi:hypothetical protein